MKAEMRAFMPLFAAVAALLTEAAERAAVQEATVLSSEAISLHNEGHMLGQTASTPIHRRGRARSPLLAVALLAATAATVLLIFQCFRALQSNKNWSFYGVNIRRLAKGDSDPCGVGLDRENQRMCAM